MDSRVSLSPTTLLYNMMFQEEAFRCLAECQETIDIARADIAASGDTRGENLVNSILKSMQNHHLLSNLDVPILNDYLLKKAIKRKSNNCPRFQSIEKLIKRMQSKSLVCPLQVLSSQPTKPIPPAPFFAQVDAICREVEAHVLCHPGYSVQKAFSAISQEDSDLILNLLKEVIGVFEQKFPPPYKILVGSPVPSFLTSAPRNQKTREYPFLVKFHNLLQWGPNILDDFVAKRFLGGEQNYAEGRGLNAFRLCTGHGLSFKTELDSKEIKEDDFKAIEEAKKLIIQFGKACGLKSPTDGELTAEEVAHQMPNRKLELPLNGIVTTAVGSTDPYCCGIWKRITHTGQAYYSVNVPNRHVLHVVLSATLRIPYLLAELVWKAKQAHDGTLPQNFLEDLFENDNDTFDMECRIRKFEDFYIKWSSIFNVNSTAREVACQKIQNGVFGEIIQQKGVDRVLNEAFNRKSLIALLEDSNRDFSVGDRTREQWIQERTAPMIAFLREQNLWEAVLYQTETTQDYFLLNERTLHLFLLDCYVVAKYWDNNIEWVAPAVAVLHLK